MAHEAIPINASTMPHVSRLVREFAHTGRPRVLHANGAEAILSPTRRARKRKSWTPMQPLTISQTHTEPMHPSPLLHRKMSPSVPRR
jgi:hypothetical protein